MIFFSLLFYSLTRRLQIIFFNERMLETECRKCHYQMDIIWLIKWSLWVIIKILILFFYFLCIKSVANIFHIVTFFYFQKKKKEKSVCTLCHWVGLYNHVKKLNQISKYLLLIASSKSHEWTPNGEIWEILQREKTHSRER